MFFISLAYILDYIYNDKYEIEYSIVNSFHKYNIDFEDYPDITYDFEIIVHLNEDEDISDRLVLNDGFKEYKGSYFSERSEIEGEFNLITYSFKRKVSEIRFDLSYICN